MVEGALRLPSPGLSIVSAVLPVSRPGHLAGCADPGGLGLRQGVANLVTNACYAMRARCEAGGDAAYVPSLVVSTELCVSEVAVAFWDNGTGIADDVLLRIFNPFFTTGDGVLGAGFGLPLASDVARRGGGDLTVATEHGSWARFTMTVPVNLPPTAVEVLDDRYDGDMSTVRTSGSAEPVGE